MFIGMIERILLSEWETLSVRNARDAQNACAEATAKAQWRWIFDSSFWTLALKLQRWRRSPKDNRKILI